MNLKKGFARLARVTASAYAVVAVFAMGITAVVAWQVEGAGMRQFRVDVSASGEALGACRIRYDVDGFQIPCGRRVERFGTPFMVPVDATDAEADRAIRFGAEQEINRRQRQRERDQQSAEAQQESTTVQITELGVPGERGVKIG
jgi:hypothetical protein